MRCCSFEEYFLKQGRCRMTFSINLDNFELQRMTLPSNYIIPDSFIRQLEKRLAATFLKDPEEGNLCFANNNAEIRDDFKQVFTLRDVGDYFASLDDNTVLNPPPLPKTAAEFWAKVQKGKNIQ